MKTQVNTNKTNIQKNADDIEDIYTYISRTSGDYATMQRLVYSGFAQDAYPWGTIIVVPHAVYGDLIFEPVAYDYLFKETDPGSHSMTIMMRNATSQGVQFDAPEAMYCPATTMAAGTYCFTIPNYDASYGGNASYKFTLTQAVPAGGCVVFNWPYNVQVESSSSYIETYDTLSSTTRMERVTLTKVTDVTDPESGTFLGTCDGTGDMNHIQRIRYGSNCYAQSAIDQLLNSDAEAGSVWSPTHAFDRPPSWVATSAGFIAGLPSDFVAVVETVKIKNRTNSVWEMTPYTIKSNYYLNRKFYLPSTAEIFGPSTDAVSGVEPDGTQFPIYNGITNNMRIKYDNNGTAKYWWFRSPNPSHAHYVRSCNPSGAVNGTIAFHSIPLVVACTICG